jgi:hypothetical protein
MIRTRVNAASSAPRTKSSARAISSRNMAKSKSASAGLAPIQRSCARHEPSLPRGSVSTE